MSPEEKKAANRANARKSTGPRTGRGKAKSSLNAVKFGVYATTLVLPGEDEDAYRKMEKSNLQYFAPVGPVENRLVRELTFEEWRLERIERTAAVIHARQKEAQIEDILTSLDDREAGYFSSAYGDKYGVQVIKHLSERTAILGHPLTKLSARLRARDGIETEIPEKTDEEVKDDVEAKLRRIQELDGTLMEVTDPTTESGPHIYLVTERRSAVRAYMAYVVKLKDLQAERQTMHFVPFPVAGKEPATSTNAKPPAPSPPYKSANQNRRRPGNKSSANGAISARTRLELQKVLSRLRAKSGT